MTHLLCLIAVSVFGAMFSVAFASPIQGGLVDPPSISIEFLSVDRNAVEQYQENTIQHQVSGVDLDTVFKSVTVVVRYGSAMVIENTTSSTIEMQDRMPDQRLQFSIPIGGGSGS